jgi:hypothetical protein
VLLDQVLHVGDRLEPVGQRRDEQVLDEQPLRRRAKALAAMLREQQGADLQQLPSGPPALTVRQLTIPARVPSGRATASWVESRPIHPSCSQRRRRARGSRKPIHSNGWLAAGSVSSRLNGFRSASSIGRSRTASSGMGPSLRGLLGKAKPR